MPKIIAWGGRNWTKNSMFILEQPLSTSEHKKHSLYLHHYIDYREGLKILLTLFFDFGR
jgi:hypothetical protein